MSVKHTIRTSIPCEMKKQLKNVFLEELVAITIHCKQAKYLFSPAFTCSKLTIETLEQGVRYGQS